MKKQNAKELAGMINLVMQDNENFKGNLNELLDLFDQQGLKAVRSLWYYGLNGAFHNESNTRPCKYSFYKGENGHVLPIHYSVIEKAQNTCYLKKKHEVEEEPRITEENINKCISILKRLGYKVYKPITEFQEV